MAGDNPKAADDGGGDSSGGEEEVASTGGNDDSSEGERSSSDEGSSNDEEDESSSEGEEGNSVEDGAASGADETDADGRKLSAYEVMRLERIRRNKAYLAQLGLESERGGSGKGGTLLSPYAAEMEQKKKKRRRKRRQSSGGDGPDDGPRRALSSRRTKKAVNYSELPQRKRAFVSFTSPEHETRSRNDGEEPKKRTPKPRTHKDRMSMAVFREFRRIESSRKQNLKAAEKDVREAEKEYRLAKRSADAFQRKERKAAEREEKRRAAIEAAKERRKEVGLYRSMFHEAERRQGELYRAVTTMDRLRNMAKLEMHRKETELKNAVQMAVARFPEAVRAAEKSLDFMLAQAFTNEENAEKPVTRASRRKRKAKGEMPVKKKTKVAGKGSKKGGGVQSVNSVLPSTSTHLKLSAGHHTGSLPRPSHPSLLMPPSRNFVPAPIEARLKLNAGHPIGSIPRAYLPLPPLPQSTSTPPPLLLLPPSSLLNGDPATRIAGNSHISELGGSGTAETQGVSSKKSKRIALRQVGGPITPIFSESIQRKWLAGDVAVDPSIAYVPQVGDIVLYYPSAHREFLEKHPDDRCRDHKLKSRVPLWDRVKGAEIKDEKGGIEPGKKPSSAPWWNDAWVTSIEDKSQRHPILCRVEQSHAEFPYNPDAIKKMKSSMKNTGKDDKKISSDTSSKEDVVKKKESKEEDKKKKEMKMKKKNDESGSAKSITKKKKRRKKNGKGKANSNVPDKAAIKGETTEGRKSQKKEKKDRTKDKKRSSKSKTSDKAPVKDEKKQQQSRKRSRPPLALCLTLKPLLPVLPTDHASKKEPKLGIPPTFSVITFPSEVPPFIVPFFWAFHKSYAMDVGSRVKFQFEDGLWYKGAVTSVVPSAQKLEEIVLAVLGGDLNLQLPPEELASAILSRSHIGNAAKVLPRPDLCAVLAFMISRLKERGSKTGRTTSTSSRASMNREASKISHSDILSLVHRTLPWWDGVNVTWDDNSMCEVSAWELTLLGEQAQVAAKFPPLQAATGGLIYHLDEGIRSKVEMTIKDFVKTMPEAALFNNPVTESIAPGYHWFVPDGMCIKRMLRRLKRHPLKSTREDYEANVMNEQLCYYRSVGSILSDISDIYYNCALYNEPTSNIVLAARQLVDRIKPLLLDIESQYFREQDRKKKEHEKHRQAAMSSERTENSPDVRASEVNAIRSSSARMPDAPFTASINRDWIQKIEPDHSWGEHAVAPIICDARAKPVGAGPFTCAPALLPSRVAAQSSITVPSTPGSSQKNEADSAPSQQNSMDQGSVWVPQCGDRVFYSHKLHTQFVKGHSSSLKIEQRVVPCVTQPLPTKKMGQKGGMSTNAQKRGVSTTKNVAKRQSSKRGSTSSWMLGTIVSTRSVFPANPTMKTRTFDDISPIVQLEIKFPYPWTAGEVYTVHWRPCQLKCARRVEDGQHADKQRKVEKDVPFSEHRAKTSVEAQNPDKSINVATCADSQAIGEAHPDYGVKMDSEKEKKDGQNGLPGNSNVCAVGRNEKSIDGHSKVASSLVTRKGEAATSAALAVPFSDRATSSEPNLVKRAKNETVLSAPKRVSQALCGRCSACGLQLNHYTFVRPAWITPPIGILPPKSFDSAVCRPPLGISSPARAIIDRCLETLKHRCIQGIPPDLIQFNGAVELPRSTFAATTSLSLENPYATGGEDSSSMSTRHGGGQASLLRARDALCEAHFLPPWLSLSLPSKPAPVLAVSTRRTPSKEQPKHTGEELTHEAFMPLPNLSLELVLLRIRSGYYRHFISAYHDIREAYVSTVIFILRGRRKRVKGSRGNKSAKEIASILLNRKQPYQTNSTIEVRTKGDVINTRLPPNDTLLNMDQSIPGATLKPDELLLVDRIAAVRKLYATAMVCVTDPSMAENLFGNVVEEHKKQLMRHRAEMAARIPLQEIARKKVQCILEALSSDPCDGPRRPLYSDEPNPIVKVKVRLNNEDGVAIGAREKLAQVEEGKQIPGCICGGYYCCLDNETCAVVANKLGCSWKELATINEDRYGSIKEKSNFEEATMLRIPERGDAKEQSSKFEGRAPIDENTKDIVNEPKIDSIMGGDDLDSDGRIEQSLATTVSRGEQGGVAAANAGEDGNLVGDAPVCSTGKKSGVDSDCQSIDGIGKVEKDQSTHHAPILGCVYQEDDESLYCSFDDETCASIASKLGCSWGDLAMANKDRYGVIHAKSRFQEGTILAIPRDRDESKVLELRSATKPASLDPPDEHVSADNKNGHDVVIKEDVISEGSVKDDSSSDDESSVDMSEPITLEPSYFEMNAALTRALFGVFGRSEVCVKCKMSKKSLFYCRVRRAHSKPDFDWDLLSENGGINGILHVLLPSSYPPAKQLVLLPEGMRSSSANAVGPPPKAAPALETSNVQRETVAARAGDTTVAPDSTTKRGGNAHAAITKSEDALTGNNSTKPSSGVGSKVHLQQNGPASGSSNQEAVMENGVSSSTKKMLNPVEILQKAEVAVQVARDALTAADNLVKARPELSEDFIRSNFPVDNDDGHYEYCTICGLSGDILCCETCPNVAHASCAGLEDVPEDDWFCKKCSEKRASASTRSNVNEAHQDGGPASGRTESKSVEGVADEKCDKSSYEKDSKNASLPSLADLLEELRSYRQKEKSSSESSKRDPGQSLRGNSEISGRRAVELEHGSEPESCVVDASALEKEQEGGDDSTDEGTGENEKEEDEKHKEKKQGEGTYCNDEADRDEEQGEDRDKERDEIKVGTTILKDFDDRPFEGTVTRLPTEEEPFYRVRYEDGDEEEMSDDEVHRHFARKKASIVSSDKGVKKSEQQPVAASADKQKRAGSSSDTLKPSDMPGSASSGRKRGRSEQASAVREGNTKSKRPRGRPRKAK